MTALLPPTARSRTAHGLTAAAAEGRFALQVCAGCAATLYPPRDACPRCLSPHLPFRDVPRGGVLLSETTVRASVDPYFRPRLPLRIGTVHLDAGVTMLAHVHRAVAAGGRVRMRWLLDRGGGAVACALPDPPGAAEEEDAVVQERTCDPRGRRVLIAADAGTTAPDAPPDDPLAQALTRALHAAGAEIVARGSDPDVVIALPPEMPPPYLPPGGVFAADAAAAAALLAARGGALLRLAQAHGPALRRRGGTFVTILSVYALMNRPDLGLFCAAEAACLSLAQALRGELRADGARLLNVFTGPPDVPAFAPEPPPKVSPAALAAAVVQALRDGIEDAYVGDTAQDVRARLAAQPKALERDLWP